jgi:hypothetical protein
MRCTPIHKNKGAEHQERIENSMASQLVYAAYSLLLTAVDLTRVCSNHKNYTAWMNKHGHALESRGIADYFVNAVMALDEQVNANPTGGFDAFVATETLSDILMASALLSAEELQSAAKIAALDAVSAATTTGLQNFMAVSYDDDEQQIFYDAISARSREKATQLVASVRGEYASVIDTLDVADLQRILSRIRIPSQDFPHTPEAFATAIGEEYEGTEVMSKACSDAHHDDCPDVAANCCDCSCHFL